MSGLAPATARAVEIRELYHQLERAHEGQPWSRKDDVLGLVNDVGALARLVMSAEGQWAGDANDDARRADKLAECLWWILSLADRLDVDIDAAYADKLGRVEANLRASIERLPTD